MYELGVDALWPPTDRTTPNRIASNPVGRLATARRQARSGPACQPASTSTGTCQPRDSTARQRQPERIRTRQARAPHPEPTGSQLAVLDQVSTARLQTLSRPGSLSRYVSARYRKGLAEGGQAVHGNLSGRRPVVQAKGSTTHHPIRQPASRTLPAPLDA